MPSLISCRLLGQILGVLALLLLTVACGTGSEGEQSTPTPEATATVVPTPTAEPDDDGIVRTAWNKTGDAGGWIWNGISWVWDRGSDGANAVWDGIRAGSNNVWGTVTGLPATSWDAITRFWRTIRGFELGRIALSPIGWPEILSPTTWLDGLMGFLQGLVIGLLKIVGVVAVIVLLIFGVIRWRLWMHLVRLFWGSAEKGLSKVHTPGTPPSKQSTPNWPRTRSPMRSQPEKGAGSTRPPAVTTGVQAKVTHVREGWSKTQIQELRDSISSQTIFVLFGWSIKSEGKPVNDLELMQTTGRSRAQIRMDITAFGRDCRSINPTASLPIETVEPTDHNSQMAYVVPVQYLEWWFED